MRVVVAPDSFGGMLSAAEAAGAFADGWSEVASGDDLVLVPLSDGGPGMVAALAAALPESEIRVVDARSASGIERQGAVLVADRVAYVESATACGLEELREDGGDVGTGTTYGVGDLIAAAARFDDVKRVVVGLGGSGTNDGGAGMWARLGAQPAAVLQRGGLALKDLEGLVPPAPFEVDVVAATDVDNPLLGLYGASAVFGPQKGADHELVFALDAALERWADAVEAAVDAPGLRNEPGAGAAGGLGFGLLALGAERLSGADVVMSAVGLYRSIEGADLVVTGEGRFDTTSLRGKVASGVAHCAQMAGVPCVVAAGQAQVGSRDAAAHGVDEIWSVAELFGSAEAALRAGADGVRALGAAVALSWTR